MHHINNNTILFTENFSNSSDFPNHNFAGVFQPSNYLDFDVILNPA